MPFHEVIDVVTVRHGFVPAIRPVPVRRVVRATRVIGRARRGIGCVHRDGALVDVTVVAPMQVTVVHVVGVIAVLQARVTATRPVLVRVFVVDGVAHGISFRLPLLRCERERSSIA